MEAKIVDTYVETYIRDLLPGHHPFLTGLEEIAARDHVPIVQPEVAQLMKLLLAQYQPKRVLEIGAAIGYSGSLMAIEMKKGHIDTIELNEETAARAGETFKSLKQSGLTETSIDLHLGDAREVIETLNEAPYDLIFIDAAKGHYEAFLDLIMPRLKIGGLIISDNVLFKGMVATDHYVIRRKITIVKRMRSYLKCISSHPELTTSILSVGDGVALSLKKEKESHE